MFKSLTALALVAALLGVSLPAAEESPGVLVSTGWLAAHLDDMELRVIHVGFGRAPAVRSTFDDGHIPFAHPLEWSAVAMTRDGLPNELPPAAEMSDALRRIGVEARDRLVLYDTGSGLEAARAFVALEYLGLAGRVSILDGQWKKWVLEGRDVSQVYSGVEPSAFVPLLRGDVLADRRAVEDLAWTGLEPAPTAVLLDARPREEYAGAVAGEGILRPGHLPGAMSLPWTTLLAGGDLPVFLPEAELRACFEAKGARPGRRVLAYCRSGVQASLVYVAARRLELPVSLYDGSYADWSLRSELPVESRWARR